MEDKEIFQCYSLNLFHFLKNNGLRYMFRGINHKTKKNYWLFENNDKLSGLLREWNSTKPK